MSLGRSLSITKRRLSISRSNSDLEDEVARELARQVNNNIALDAPVGDVRQAADHVVELTLAQCPSSEVCVFADRAQCTRLVNVEALKSENVDKAATKKQ